MPRSHYVRNDGGGDSNVYGDGKNVVNRSHSKLRSVTQEENGVYRVVVDLPFVAVSALRSLWTSQESSSRQFVCCSSPAGLAQEPPCTIAIVVELRVAFPPFQDVVRSIRASRRFWAAPREQGMWEKDVCFLWRSMGRKYPDWEDSQYLQHFRISKDTFWFL